MFEISMACETINVRINSSYIFRLLDNIVANDVNTMVTIAEIDTGLVRNQRVFVKTTSEWASQIVHPIPSKFPKTKGA